MQGIHALLDLAEKIVDAMVFNASDDISMHELAL